MNTSMELVINVFGTIVLLIMLALVWREWVYRRKQRERKLQQAIDSGVAKLPAHQAQLLDWHTQGYTYLEIAEMVDVPKDEILAELSKAFATLRLQIPVEENRRKPGRVRSFVMRQVVRMFL